MTTDELIRALREYASFYVDGGGMFDTLVAAADRLEELDERVDIMMDSTERRGL